MLEVLWEDNHLLVVNKPAGLPVQGDETGDQHLLEIAEKYIREKYNKPGAAFVGLIHRIDRPVSGTMMLAKTSKALNGKHFKKSLRDELADVLITHLKVLKIYSFV